MAQLLAETGKYSVIVAIGFIVDGGSYRHDFVAKAVIEGIVQVSLKTGVPVLSAFLTPHHFHEHATHVEFFREPLLTNYRKFAQVIISIILMRRPCTSRHHFRESRKEYRPRRAWRPRLREPRFRVSWLLPFTAERFAQTTHPQTPGFQTSLPGVKWAIRRINTSARTLRSVTVVSCALIFSKSPRRITVPSSRPGRISLSGTESNSLIELYFSICIPDCHKVFSRPFQSASRLCPETPESSEEDSTEMPRLQADSDYGSPHGSHRRRTPRSPGPSCPPAPCRYLSGKFSAGCS